MADRLVQWLQDELACEVKKSRERAEQLSFLQHEASRLRAQVNAFNCELELERKRLVTSETLREGLAKALDQAVSVINYYKTNPTPRAGGL